MTRAGEKQEPPLKIARLPLKQQGLSLLMTLIITLSVSCIGIGILFNHHQQQDLTSQTHVVKQLAVNQIVTQLFQFAATQGVNSLSDVGHLPCPSLIPNGPAQVACLNSNVGYLPRVTHVAINYLNATVPHQQALGAQNIAWQYAVSSQVLQPNALNWSKKVDWSKPALIIKTTDQTYNDVVAIVAANLSPSKSGLLATPPFRIIRQHEMFRQVQAALMTQTATTLAFLPVLGSIPKAPPHIQQQAGQAVGIPAECQCRCTKTRCTCNCLEPAIWVSEAPCLMAQPFCQPVSEWLKTDIDPWTTEALETLDSRFSVCQSAIDQPCQFKGASSLLNGWPVSEYSPAASNPRSCRPTLPTQCPTSSQSTACECQFNWPAGVVSQLARIQLQVDNQQWVAHFNEH